MFFLFDWFLFVNIYSDFFYFVFVWCFVFVFFCSFSSYLRLFSSTSLFFVDFYFTNLLLNDMDSSWDFKGCSKYNFLFYFAFLNYFSFIFYQFTWLHFSIVFDLFSLFLFMWPLFFGYVVSFILEYGFSYVSFVMGNNWVRSWFFSDLLEWFSTTISFFFRSLFGDLLFSKFLSISFFGFFWPIVYFYVLFITFCYLLYIPLACFVRYVSVFTALSVLWNVWVSSSFSILTNCLGFYSSFVVLPSWFFFCVLFLSFEATYVLIHIILLLMLYIKMVSVVCMHKKSVFSFKFDTSCLVAGYFSTVVLF